MGKESAKLTLNVSPRTLGIGHWFSSKTFQPQPASIELVPPNARTLPEHFRWVRRHLRSAWYFGAIIRGPISASSVSR
jgi:hypothetical protein